jgi:hypothetical protein
MDTRVSRDVRDFDDLPLETLEEASGELHRRIALALRDIGEERADTPDSQRRSPRQRVAALAVLLESTAQTLAAMAAGTEAATGRIDRHPAAVAAVMYGAPTLSALLGRLEQDRRMLASHARGLEARLGSPARGAWGDLTVRQALSEVAIAAPAECAHALELQLGLWDEEEPNAMRAALEGALGADV